MSYTIKRSWIKATDAEVDVLRYSFRCMISTQRGFLRVTTDALEFREWRIPYSDIDEAILFSVRSLLIPGYILRVRSRGTTYGFSLSDGAFWRGDLPFPVAREKGKITNSWSILLLRFAWVLMVIYLLWFKRR